MLIDGEVRGALDIPWLGSLIARNSFTKGVQGLDTIPVADRPPVNLVHLVLPVDGRHRHAPGPGRRRSSGWRDAADATSPSTVGSCRFAAVAGPLAALALELGWISTEVGRQPWTVYGVLRTVDAAGQNSGLWWVFGVVVRGLRAR